MRSDHVPDPLSERRRPTPVAPESLHTANDLLQARLAARISRRDLIERAAQLGLAAGVVGILLNATGDTVEAAKKPVAARKPLKPKGKRQSGGELIAGLVGNIDTLNPYVTDLYTSAFDVLSGVMDGLLAFDTRQRLRPALAERYEIADDGKSYTFKLRQGVTFHNGDPFTAADVVATWQMIMNDDLPVWSRLGWEKIAAIEVTDPATIVVRMDGLYAPFLSNIAAGFLSGGAIAPERYLKRVRDLRKQFSAKPIGTGPFRFKDVQDEVVVLERYDKHWNGRPRLDRIRVRFFESHEELLAALERGEVQVVHRTGRIGESNRARALQIEDAVVLQFTGQTWGHLDLKQYGLLTDTKVRQALDYATPKDDLIRKVLDGEAVRAVADQSPSGSFFNAQITPRPYDLKKAQGLLRRAGLEMNDDGVFARGDELLEIELWGEKEDPLADEALRLIARSWKKMGAKVSVKLAEGARLWGPKGYQFTERMTAGYYRWTNVNDPDNMYYWHSAYIPTEPGGFGGNVPAFFAPYAFQDRLDDLTSRAAAETDPVKRKDHYLKIQQLLHDEVPVIFLYWDLLYAAANRHVGGFWPSAYTYLLWNAKDWYLTK
jgi:peptide/nickel transport system substrate-binding protein